MNVQLEKEAGRRKTRPDGANSITPEMTILDIISAHRETELLFKGWKRKQGSASVARVSFSHWRKPRNASGFPWHRHWRRSTPSSAATAKQRICNWMEEWERKGNKMGEAKKLRLTETVTGAG